MTEEKKRTAIADANTNIITSMNATAVVKSTKTL